MKCNTSATAAAPLVAFNVSVDTHSRLHVGFHTRWSDARHKQSLRFSRGIAEPATNPSTEGHGTHDNSQDDEEDVQLNTSPQSHEIKSNGCAVALWWIALCCGVEDGGHATPVVFDVHVLLFIAGGGRRGEGRTLSNERAEQKTWTSSNIAGR
jgi:hypothetical protein